MTDTTEQDNPESDREPDEAELKLLYAMRRRTNIRLLALAIGTVFMLAMIGVLAWQTMHHQGRVSPHRQPPLHKNSDGCTITRQKSE